MTGFVASGDLRLTGVKGASALSRSLSSLPVAFHCHLKNALNSQEWFCQDSQKKKKTHKLLQNTSPISHSPGPTGEREDSGQRLLCTVKSTRLKNLHGFRSSAAVQEGFERVPSIKGRSLAVTFTCSAPPLHSYQTQGWRKKNHAIKKKKKKRWWTPEDRQQSAGKTSQPSIMLIFKEQLCSLCAWMCKIKYQSSISPPQGWAPFHIH